MNRKNNKIMKNVLKKYLKKVAVIFIYSIVFVPNFIIGFIQGFKGKTSNWPAWLTDLNILLLTFS